MLVFSGPREVICLGRKIKSTYLGPTSFLPIFTLPFLIWRWLPLPKMMQAKGRAGGEREIKDAEEIAKCVEFRVLISRALDDKHKHTKRQ